MKDYKNDSLLEIALELMESKRKPKPISKLSKEVFELKGLSQSEAKALLGQFEMDFMLSGHFICCGEDSKTGEKLWDLKSRQPFAMLEKDGNSLDDPYGNDEEVKANELNDSIQYDDSSIYGLDDDDEDTENTKDEIEEELDLFAEIDDKIKCPHCGAKISPDVDLCPECGKEV